MFYEKQIRQSEAHTLNREIGYNISIPDLTIVIRYSDMQGNEFQQEEKIPWSCYQDFINISESLDSKINTELLRTGFYENYIK